LLVFWAGGVSGFLYEQSEVEKGRRNGYDKVNKTGFEAKY
jgi:hypothetical protein